MSKSVKYGWLAVIIFLLISFSSCKPTAALSTSPIPSSIPASLPGPNPAKLGTVEKDIPYGGNITNAAMKLDIYYPKAAGGALPAVVYVHGGAWTQGDKSEGAGTTEIPEMIKRGYFVASINYRLAPRFKFPAQIEDVKCAIRFLRANASSFGINPDNIGVWGGSAGGNLVSLLGTTDAGAKLEGSGGYANYSSRVKAVVDMFGPADIALLFRNYKGTLMEEVFGTTDLQAPILKIASPVTYISRDDPPFLILQGDKDSVVPLIQSQLFYNQLQKGGVTATLVIVKNSEHGFRLSGGEMSPTRIEITNTIADFFDKYLK